GIRREPAEQLAGDGQPLCRRVGWWCVHAERSAQIRHGVPCTHCARTVAGRLPSAAALVAGTVRTLPRSLVRFPIAAIGRRENSFTGGSSSAAFGDKAARQIDRSAHPPKGQTGTRPVDLSLGAPLFARDSNGQGIPP